MDKVIGFAEIGVWVDCPECKHYFDIIDEEFQYIGESEICERLFTNTTDSCTNIDQEASCPKCNYEFILDRIDY